MRGSLMSVGETSTVTLAMDITVGQGEPTIGLHVTPATLVVEEPEAAADAGESAVDVETPGVDTESDSS